MSTHFVIFFVILCLALLFILIAAVFFKRRKQSIMATADPGIASDVGSGSDQVYVGNLLYNIGKDVLRHYFSQFGTIKDIRIIRNYRTGQSKGYAFVQYTHHKEASRALKAHGKDLKGRAMVVRIAKTRQVD